MRLEVALVAGAVTLAMVSGNFAQSAKGEPRQSMAANGQAPAVAAARGGERPKLVVMIVVDQMRGDYVDKFLGQWSGGLRRLVREGAWFRDAAYPYAATETCVGHSTISTGALPASHGMITNDWWDRETQRNVTCTSDPNVRNEAYAGGKSRGGDSAARMLMPAFASELKLQSGLGTRIFTVSLKARAAITLAGSAGDAVTWFDNGFWTTSSAFPTSAFVESYAKAHPVAADFGKTWSLLLDRSKYIYPEIAVGAVPPPGYGPAFPHVLRGTPESKGPDSAFYLQWAASPCAETYLAEMAATAVEKLGLGKGPGTDYLGVSFSSVDYVGHAYGPRSWEIQDELARLDRDLGVFFSRLDKAVGRNNYVVALSADHGVAPIVEDMQKNGLPSGWLRLADVKEGIEKTLRPLGYENPVAEIDGSDVYFAAGVYERLKKDSGGLRAVLGAIESVPGVAHVYRAEELQDRPATRNPVHAAEAASFFKARSGDLEIVPRPYWVWDYSAAKMQRHYGATHGTPYRYDQHVPILFMGFGIRPGEYYGEVTPADIAPTLAALCGITLASRDGHVLEEAIRSSGPRALNGRR
jgi:predicted AlkP superfamily pyrophosphatase or phosphodiesterase